MSTPKHSRRDRLVSIAHYLTGLVLALKGVSYLEHQPPPWHFISLCFVSAALVIVVTLLHQRIEKRLPSAQGLIYLVESIVCGVLAYKTFAEGKSGLPYAWALAAIILAGRAAWEFRRSVERPPDPKSR